MNIYFDNFGDLDKALMILKEHLVCDSFSPEQDVPRTLKCVQEGIEASLYDLIEPSLLRRLDYYNYILPTAPGKTFKALAEGIRNYLTNLAERLEYEKSVKKMEGTTEWIVTFGTTVNTDDDCLTEKLTTALRKSPYKFRLCEDLRDGEGLSLRYHFVWRPSEGLLALPQYPKYWEILELEPYKSIYPD